MKEKFYIATAIAYTSKLPHIGNTYEAVLADAISRYKKERGFDVFFLTGTDEHGQKIQQEAIKEGKTPQDHVDGIAGEIRKIWDLMNVDYDDFIRTTDPRHKETVQKAYQILFDQGDIYKGEYSGLYCTDCESFYTESQLDEEGNCPLCHRGVHPMEEDAYFFKLSKYEKQLREYIEKHPEFIYPESRKNEMLNNFINKGLKDLCVSRTSFDWGIPIGIDEGHVAYVWMDALLNYISALGYLQEDDSLFQKYWPCDVHIIGKDIVRFHTIYWPIFLMALNVPLPKQVYGHPWLLMGSGEKMSKSRGNVLYATDLVEEFSVDRVRYSILREMPFNDDGHFSKNILIQRTNTELVNIIGNLLNRTVAMSQKYFEGLVEKGTEFEPMDIALMEEIKNHIGAYEEAMDTYHISKAMGEVVEIAKSSNRYIDETTPWILAKGEDKSRLKTVLYVLTENLRIVSILLRPFIPETSEKMLDQLGTEVRDYNSIYTYGSLEADLHSPGGEVLYTRLELEEEEEEVIQEDIPFKEEITYDDFAKLDLRVATVLKVEDHPKADRLYVLKLQVGSKERQVVSGIRQYYKKEELEGKKVVYLANLKPIKLRGILSEGMVLAEGRDETTVKVLEATLDGETIS